ncbi:MAG: hypothetical protein K5683_09540 [Prevotella sp.]|nr:hypothetical protein [Prevotella sp.]
MKKVLFAFAAMMALAACSNKQTAVTTQEDNRNVVTFEVARNYFVRNDLDILPECPKITSEETFYRIFGMATTMGDDGQPTEIDFDRQFVLAIVMPLTDFETEITPMKVEERGNSLLYTFEVKRGEEQSYSMQPASIIILDRKYENKDVVLVSEQEVNYFPAIDRYLTEQLGKQYAEGEHCVSIHNIVAVDEEKADDILVWGDFWVFNYNLVGDTLKCISGGAHPGLMHIQQTAKGYEVKGFEQVEDGDQFLPTARMIFADKYDAFQAVNSDEKRREKLRAQGLSSYVKSHHLAATMYQDYGWEAVKLER